MQYLKQNISLKVSSVEDSNAATNLPNGDVVEFDIVNNIDAILETKY